MKYEIVLIGPMGGGGVPTNGASVKNYYLENKLRECTNRMVTIDTEYWKKNPLVLLKMLGIILFYPKAKFILSLNNLSAYRVISLFYRLPRKRCVYYWVIGGSIADWIKEGRVSSKPYSVIHSFLVEGKSMVQSLSESGLNNAILVPNFKKITYLPQKGVQGDVVRFLFLSRINPHKGCDFILSAARKLNEKYQKRFLIDFYGNVAPEYPDFTEKINAILNVQYKGFIDLRDIKNYDILASYDALLFPTYWHGEGFPGIIVDAFIAGLPVIASDWHLNKEIVSDGETGFLIKHCNEEELYKVMEQCIITPQILHSMKSACQREAIKYDVDAVLTPELFKTIGLI